ncbi:MAG: aldo/keto reductase [Actinobacteria bacterium]|nr:aldo/keto reductase [Actinomycetota bacterium]
MKSRRLGAHGPEVSVIGFGAWEMGGEAYGPNPPDAEVVGAVDAALEAGIDWIDTAEVYGNGRSEELVGRALRGRRDEVLIATKVAPEPEGTGFRPEQVRRAVEGSLRRLGVDHVDLYQLHWPDRTGVPVEETWGSMAELAQDGLVRFVGVSNFDRDLIERCLGIRHVDSLQPELSMLYRDRAELVAWCGEAGIGTVAYGPLAYGLLTGAIGPGTEFGPGDWRADPKDGDARRLFGPGNRERNLALVDELRPIAERLDVTLAQLALAWTVHQPGVTSAIAGSRNPAHVRQNAEAGEIDLDPATLREVEEVLAAG